MNLQEFQSKLLGFIKSTYEPTPQDPAYLRQLRTSKELDLVKEICIWWRCFQIESYCPLTSGWLKRRGVFEIWVQQYYQNTNVPPYIELAGISFLGYVQFHITDPVTYSIAAFEQAIIQVKRGDLREHSISWDCDPYAILDSLLHKVPYERETAEQRYKVTVAHGIPGLFSVTSIPSTPSISSTPS